MVANKRAQKQSSQTTSSTSTSNAMVENAKRVQQTVNPPKYLTYEGYTISTVIQWAGMNVTPPWETTVRLSSAGSVLATFSDTNWVQSQNKGKNWVDEQIALAEANTAPPATPTKLTTYTLPEEVAGAYIKKDNELMDGQGILSKSEVISILKSDFGMTSTSADAYLSSAVVSAFANQQMHYKTAANKLSYDFGYSGNDITDVLESELETIDKAYNYQNWLDKVQFENISLPLKLSAPTKAGEKIPKTNFEYWDGDLTNHDWVLHGHNNVTETFTHGPNNEIFPKIMVDSMGCYAMCMAHYRAEYNPSGEFFGWVPLRKNETIAAGTPMASVMQFFVKPVRVTLPYFHIEDSFYLNGERHPEWSKAVGMKLDPKDFFFLEPELARENKIPVLKDEGFFKSGHLVKGGYFNVNDDLTGEAQMPTLGRGPSINGYPRLEAVDGYYGTGAFYGFDDIGFSLKSLEKKAKAVGKGAKSVGKSAVSATSSAASSASRAATSAANSAAAWTAETVDTVQDITLDDVTTTTVNVATTVAETAIDATTQVVDWVANPIPAWISKDDRVAMEDSKGAKSALRKMPAMPTFDRDFDSGKKSFFGMNQQQDKNTYACSLEWYTGTGWSPYQPHPTDIPAADIAGKTMVIYRFPRQLDPVDDKHELAAIAKAGGPDWSIPRTKHCYPYPREAKGGYALIGRLQPGLSTSDSYSAAKYEVNIPSENKIYGGRRKINLIPMVSPRSHPKAGYRTNILANDGALERIAEWIPGDLSKLEIKRAAGRFCFDSEYAGLEVSVTDPTKYAYFNNPEINSTYFVRNDLKPGSTFFVIGQGLTSYDSLDTQVRSGEVIASERITLSLGGKKKIEDLHNMNPPLRSHQHTPRSETDGSMAGLEKADYLIPSAVMTTIDLASGQNVPGSLTVKDTFKRITGKEFDIGIFQELNIPGGNQNKENKAFYDVNYEGQTFSFPYSIAGFTIPSYWKGPTLQYDPDGNVITTKEGSVKPGDKVNFNFYPPFGQILTKEVEIYEEIIQQEGGFDESGEAITGENVLDALEDEFGEPTENVTIEILSDEVDENVETAVSNTLLDRYGKTKFVIDDSYEEFFVGGKNYMTGQQIVDAGGRIPVDLKIGNKTADLGAVRDMDFTRSPLYELEDVTHKWGEHTGGRDSVVGDTRMQFVQARRDIDAEIRGFGALGAMDIIDNAQEVTTISGWTDSLPEAGTNVGKSINNFIDEQKYGIDDVDVFTVGLPFVLGVAGVVAFAAPAGIGWGVGTAVAKSVGAFSGAVGDAIKSVTS